MSAIALRPYLPADAPALADLFRASIAELTGEDYDSEAWLQHPMVQRSRKKAIAA